MRRPRLGRAIEMFAMVGMSLMGHKAPILLFMVNEKNFCESALRWIAPRVQALARRTAISRHEDRDTNQDAWPQIKSNFS